MVPPTFHRRNSTAHVPLLNQNKTHQHERPHYIQTHLAAYNAVKAHPFTTRQPPFTATEFLPQVNKFNPPRAPVDDLPRLASAFQDNCRSGPSERKREP